MTRTYFLTAIAVIAISTTDSPAHAGLDGQIDFNMTGHWFVAGNGIQRSVDAHLYAGSDPFLDWSFYAVTSGDVGKVYVMPESLATSFVQAMTDNVSDSFWLMVGGAMAGLGEDSIWNYDGFLPLRGSLVHPEDRTGTGDIAGIEFLVITFQLTSLELTDEGNHYWRNEATGVISLWASPQEETGTQNPRQNRSCRSPAARFFF